MMWTDFVDVMNFIFIANDMWMLWTAFVLGRSFYMEDQEMKLGPEQNCTDADENGDLTNRDGCTRHVSDFFKSKKN